MCSSWLKPVVVAVALVVAAASAGRGAPMTKTIPPPRPVEADRLVGAYYFPGWSQPESWYCMKANPHVQHPLLGYYREGDPDAAEWHIKWALEHGVSFFAFDYYTEEGAQMLEAALDDGFLRAPSIGKFRFCLNWCNHAPAEKMTAEELERFGDLVIPRYLTHPSCLRIEGKPVVMILAGHSFVKTLGVEGARKAFGRFEERCREAGLPGVHLVFCEGEIRGANNVKDSFAAGVQAFCLYNYPYAGTKVTGPGGAYAEETYAHLIAQGEGLWKHWTAITGGRFWPTVMPGWDRRPWTKDRDLVRTGSTPDLFEDSLRKAREMTKPGDIVMIEAWNEWGEGSILEPSVEYGFAYLDRVRSVFCPDAGAHEDTHPAALGLKAPVYDLQLPAIDTWRFDRDSEGWTGTTATGLAEPPRHHAGMLIAASRTTDPQVTSPRTYLRCEEYARLRVRMRLTPPEGSPAKATGQLFWSTVERSMCQETSVLFPVHLDGRWHEYEADLTAVPGWKGTTDRLRLDPVDVAGVRIEVDEVRVVGL